MPWYRRPSVNIQVWVPLAVIFVLWLLSAPDRSLLQRCAAGLVLGLLNMVCAASFRRAARRKSLEESIKGGIRLIAMSFGLGSMACFYVVMDWYLNPGNRTPYNLADLLFLATYPLTVAGLLKMPRSERRGVGLGRILVDSGVFLVGAGLPLWFFAVKPGLATASGFGAVVVLAYPLMIFSGILCLNIVLLTRSPRPSREAFALLVTSVGISWLADLLFLLDSVEEFFRHGMINWIDVLDAVALIFALLAADRIENEGVERRETLHPPASGPLPIVTISVVSAWLLAFISYGHMSPVALTRVVFCVVLLFVFLLLREISVMRDGRRWMAAEVLRESRARSEALVRHSSDVIMVVDARRAIRFASPAVAEALGVGADTLEGRPIVDIVHPQDRAKGSQFIDRLLLAPKSLQTLQWRLRHEDGSYRSFETVGSNAVNESAVDGLVLNSRDVTDRVALEEQLRRAQKMQALGQLVGGIAHNFNNILTSTMMRLGELRHRSGLTDDVIEEIMALDREATRSADLTKKLVSFGQQQFLRMRPMELRESVSRLRGELSHLLGPRVELRMETEGSPEWVKADAGLLEQVILNLGANAGDAMPQGGCLLVEVRKVDALSVVPPVDSNGPAGTYVCLSFEDNGCGMDETVRQRLFEPFFTTKAVGKGVGMGLAAAHGIVRQHQGWMEVDSIVGKGTTFRVYLPKADPPAEETEARPSSRGADMGVAT